MNFYAISALINVALLLTAQIILFINIKRSRAILFFNIFNLSMLVWAASYFFWQTSSDYQTALFWVKMLMAGAIFAAPTLLHFTAVLTDNQRRFLPLVILAYLLAFVSLYFNFTSPEYIADLKNKLGIPFFPTAGRYYGYYLIQWSAFIIIAFAALIARIKKTQGEEKEFVKTLTIATLISAAAGCANYFLWFDISIPPVATSVTAAYGVVGSFLLLRNRLYKLNLFYFEFFAVIAILISLLQFFLTNQTRNWTVNLTILAIIVSAVYFLIIMRIREREHLVKIETLNLALKNTVKNIINSVDDAVLIINSEKQYLIEANRRAAELFGYKIGDDLPRTFMDFVRGKVNQTLISALRYYLENDKKMAETEILVPEHAKIFISFSPFTMEKANDAVVMIIKKNRLI